MRKVLIITYYWPPSGGSGVQRWLKFSKYLPEFGWQPIVYTPENPEVFSKDRSLLKEVPDEAVVLKTPILEPYSLYRSFLGKKGGSGNDVNVINSGKKSLKERLSLWIRANFFIPDPRIWWKRRSVRFLKEYIKGNPVDVIVSTGPPQSMHLIARAVSKATRTPWIADFRDPWTKIYHFAHLPLTDYSRKRHLKLEKQVFTQADGVIAVTPRMCDQIREVAPLQKIYCISNGYDISDYPAETKPLDEKFTLVHTGVLPVDSNPEPLWKALAELCENGPEGFKEDLRIVFAGKTDKAVMDSALSYRLPVEDKGYLPHAETIAMQLSARVLIMPTKFSEEMKVILLGKVFEYMVSGRPIISIGHTDSALNDILTQTHTGVQYGWEDVEGIRLAILEQYNEFKSAPNAASKPSFLPEYERKNLTEALAQVLEKTI